MPLKITKAHLDAADRDGYIKLIGGAIILDCPYLPQTAVEVVTAPAPGSRGMPAAVDPRFLPDGTVGYKIR